MAHISTFRGASRRQAIRGAAAIHGWCRGWMRRESLPSRPLVALAAAAAAGCSLAPTVALPPVTAWLAAMALLAAWVMLSRVRRRAAAAAVLWAAVAVAAMCWSEVRSNYFRTDDLAWSLGHVPVPVAIEAVVIEPPRLLPTPAAESSRGDVVQDAWRRTASECVVAVHFVRNGEGWRAASGRATVFVNGTPPGIASGTRVRLFGRGHRPPPPLNPGEFDLRDRSRAARCLSVIRVDAWTAVRVLSVPAPWSIAAWIDRMRDRGVHTLQKYVGTDRAGLAAALLLGSREALPRDESDAFLATGTVHILSISGLHVGFLAAAVFRVLRSMTASRGWSLVAVAGCTGIYMLLVRAETPVVRATFVVWLACLGWAFGRRPQPANSLAVAAIVVLLWQPGEVFRVGTQLSFLSTAVLFGASAAVQPTVRDDPIERLIARSRSMGERRLRWWGRKLLEAVLVGGAVWGATAPIVAARFHLFSPVGLVLNPLIAPLVAVAMAWGAACIVTATVSATLAAVCGWGCDATLGGIGWLVDLAATVPGGHAWVPAPPTWWVVGWYAVLALVPICVARDWVSRGRTWLLVAVVWGVVGCAGQAIGRLGVPAEPAVRMVVAAMGHGCGIVVRSPRGRCLVYDAGRLGAPAAARRAISSVLWDEGVRRIDVLCISHADADHFNAVPEVLNRFPVGEIVVPPPFLQSHGAAVEELLERARAAGVPVRAVHAGDELSLDPLCRVRVLHPQPENPAGVPFPAGTRGCRLVSDNETSLVVTVEAAGRRLLFTGDLEGAPLTRFVAAVRDRCDVLVAPHHGSLTTLPPDIARATDADWVVVSGPASPAWPVVREAYARARGDHRRTEVLGTGRSPDGGPGGAIRFSIDAAEVNVEQYDGRRWVRVRPQADSAAAVGSRCVSSNPAAMTATWLATNPASSSSTPLVKP